MSMMPWRKAALSSVSSSSACISMPTGSNRTVWVFPMAAAAAGGAGTPPAGRGSGLGALGRRATGGAARPVVGDVLLALLGGHLVEEHVGALEGDALHLVERPHLLRVQIQVRLRDQRVAVVADVPEVLHDLGEVPAVVQGLPLALPGQTAHRRSRPPAVVR